MHYQKLYKKESYSISFKYNIFFFCSILFLYTSNFWGMGDLYPLLAFPFVLLFLIHSEFSKDFMKSLILLVFFSVLYASIIYYYGYASLIGTIGRLVYPTTFLVLGYKLVGEKINHKKISKIFIIVIISLWGYGFLSFLKTMYYYGSMQNVMNVFGGRNILDLWGAGLIAATALSAYLSFGLALLPLIFFYRKNINFPEKFLFLIIFITSIYTIVQISSRTGLIIIIASLLTSIIFSEKFSAKKLLRIFFLFLLSLFAKFLYDLNILNIKLNVEQTYLFQRFIETSIHNDARINTWKIVYFNLWDSPLGGKTIDLKVGFAHNLWLDVGYESGVLPFILLILFTLSCFLAVMKLLRSNHPSYFKALIISMLTAFAIVFMLEPVLQGLTVYFMIFCFLIGVIHKVNLLNNN